MKFKIRYADQIVGILTIIALAALVTLLFSIGSKQRWFLRKNMYYSEFETAANLSDGMSIMFKGFDIGKIDSIRLTETDSVRVNFFVYSTYFDKMRKGSIIELVVSPIGLGSQLVFVAGNGADLLDAGSLVPRKDSAEARQYITEGLVTVPNNADGIAALISIATDLLHNLDDTVKAIKPELLGTGEADSIAPLTRIVDGLTSSIESFSELISDPVGLVPKLLESDGSVSALFNDKNALYNSVLEAIATVNGTLKNVDELVVTVDKNLPGIVSGVDTVLGSADSLLNTAHTTIKNADPIVQNVDDITSSINEEVVPQASLLVQELQISLLKMQDVLIGLKNNPLLKGGIPENTAAQGITPQTRDSRF